MSPLDHVWQILGIKRVTFRLICNCACKRMSIQDSFYPSKTWISPLQWDELISEGAFLDFFVNQCFHENFGPVHFFNAIRIKTSLKCIIFPKKVRKPLESDNCSMNWVLQFNIGPIHLLNSLIDDILALETEKSYLRKETRMSKIVSKNINKSTATEGFEKSNGEK